MRVIRHRCVMMILGPWQHNKEERGSSVAVGEWES
jgi:hypothetical protein